MGCRKTLLDGLDFLQRKGFFLMQYAVITNNDSTSMERKNNLNSLNFRYSSIHISTGFNVLHTRLNWHNKNRNTADIYLWVIVLCTSYKYAYLYCTFSIQYIRIHTGMSAQMPNGYTTQNPQRLNYTKSPTAKLHKIPNGYITQNPQRLHFTKSPMVTLHKIPNGYTS